MENHLLSSIGLESTAYHTQNLLSITHYKIFIQHCHIVRITTRGDKMLVRLKELRKEREISQQRLADAIGVSQQSINKYENHDIEPDIDTLQKFALFFDASIDYIVGLSDIRERIMPRGENDLNGEENRLVDDYRQLGEQEKQSIKLTMKCFLDRQRMCQ